MATKRMAGFCSSLLVLGAFLAGAASTSLGAGEMEKSASSQGTLDGKTFAVTTGEKGKALSEKDDLTFKDGKFHSAACDKYGFGDGPYTATVKDGTVTFEAETRSPAKGKIRWTGTVVGDRIEVIYVWTDSPHWYKPNPKPVEKWAKGELKR